jgi:hypothetical protein
MYNGAPWSGSVCTVDCPRNAFLASTVLGISSTVPYASSMATTTSTKSTRAKAAAEAQSKGEAVRATVLERLEQGQQSVLVAAERFGHTLERIIPAPVMPLVTNVQRVVAANVDFAASLARSQADFAAKVAKAVLPVD